MTDGSVGAGPLPWNALLALATTGFVMIMTETLPAGLLPQIAASLDISQGGAGQLVSAYAAGTVVAALPVVAATRRVRRRRLLLCGIFAFVVANAVTAVSASYSLTLLARFVAGASSGLLWGIIPGYARGLVAPQAAGRGLAVASVGTPLALSLGTPAASFTGSMVSWRWVFGAMSVVALGLALWVRIELPERPGQERQYRSPVTQVLRLPGVLPVLLVVIGWMLAHNLLYTYIAPFLVARRTAVRTDVVLLVFGLAALVGIAVTGVLVDRVLRRLVLGSLVVFGGATVMFATGGDTLVLYAATTGWGLAFGGASTQLNTAIADAGRGNTDVVATLVSTVWNAAIFGGGVLGAVVLRSQGAQTLPEVMLPLILGCLLVVLSTRRHAFPPPPSTTPATPRGGSGRSIP